MLKDVGLVQATLKGVTDSGGNPVTTTPLTKWKTGDSSLGMYVVIVKGNFTALGVDFETVLPVGLKNGNGASKADLSSLFGMIPGGVGRSVEVTGGEVWGPISSGQAAACDTVVSTGFTLTPGDPACRDGSQIGVAGINIP